ncbi:IclR family transcriptional regulator [Rubrobacter naiadicus]|uniref:IclR family transcriptional regulator n=1 Tax=Rubrobacter naiadicus TaxID=1392641 RepID=UPI003B58E28F
MKSRDHNKAQILKSLDTGLQVLGSFDRVKSEWGVTELAERLGASKASIYRVLATLERHRYVFQNPSTGRYRLGSSAIQLGQLAMNHLNLSESALPYMEQLRDRTGEEVHLAILEGKEAVYIAKVNGLRPVQVVSSIGDRCPAHCVSTGKILLAYADSAFVKSIIADGLVGYTDRTHATPSSLLRELELVREQGYSINWGEWREDVRGVAAPVMDASQQVVASIGICGPAFRLTEEFIDTNIPIVVDVGARLSEQLGAPPRNERAHAR